MDLALTPLQEAYRSKVRQWFDENLPATWSIADGNPLDDLRWGEVNRDWERKLARGGYIGIAWPREYGGQGLSMLEHYLFSQEYGRRCAPDGDNTIGRELTAPVLLNAGSESQKRRFLPAIARGEEVWCQAFSEPNAGSDLASLKTKAVWRDDAWRLTGHKIWSSYARYAQWALLLGRTASEDKPYKGLSLFLVPLDAPGVTARPIKQASGRSMFSEIFLDDVPVSSEWVVGAPGMGWKVAAQVLQSERATTRLYKQARYMSELAYLASIYDLRLGHDAQAQRRPDLEQQIGQVMAELLALKALNTQTVARLASGMELGPESSIVKLLWSSAHQALTHLGMDLLGATAPAPNSVDLEETIVDLYLHSRAETIFAGATEVQQMIIADRVLSLPR